LFFDSEAIFFLKSVNLSFFRPFFFSLLSPLFFSPIRSLSSFAAGFER